MPTIIKLSGSGPTTTPTSGGAMAAGYGSDHALLADRALRADYATEAEHAQAADTTDMAADLTPDSPVRDQFAYKDRDDMIRGIWSFVRYMQGYGYVPGAAGFGWLLGQDPDNPDRSLLVVDKLYVRLKAIFDSLEIRRLSHVGGAIEFSPAAAVIARVETISRSTATMSLRDSDGTLLTAAGVPLTVSDPDSVQVVYRCFFRTDDGDDKITNDFAAGDLVRCQTFNLATGQRFFWRRCIATGPDWIDLSSVVCADDSDIPMAGDHMAVFGNDTDPDRQNIIELAAYGPGSPSLTLYQGVCSFSTQGCDKVRIAARGSKFTGELVVYAADGSEMPLAAFTEQLIALKAKDITINGNTQITDGDGNVVALFAGGKLRAALIDADSLTARAIRTAEQGARTVIAGNEQLYYDDNDRLVLRVHGGSIDPANSGVEAFHTNSQQHSLTGAERTDTIYFTDDYPLDFPGQVDLSDIGVAAYVNLESDGGPVPEGMPLCSASFHVGIECDGPRSEDYDFPRRVLWSRQVDVFATGAHNLYPGTLPAAVMLDGVRGFGIDETPYRLYAEVRLSLRGVRNEAWSFSVTSDNAALPIIRHNGYNEIAADGSALRADATKYLRTIGSETGFRHENYGLRATDTGFQYTDDGGASWHDIEFSNIATS